MSVELAEQRRRRGGGEQIRRHDPGQIVDVGQAFADRRQRGRDDGLLQRGQKHRQHDAGHHRANERAVGLAAAAAPTAGAAAAIAARRSPAASVAANAIGVAIVRAVAGHVVQRHQNPGKSLAGARNRRADGRLIWRAVPRVATALCAEQACRMDPARPDLPMGLGFRQIAHYVIGILPGNGKQTLHGHTAAGRRQHRPQARRTPRARGRRVLGSRPRPRGRAAIPLRALDYIKRGGFSNAEVADYIIPPRTERHRKANRERLSVEESDRLVRLARIQAVAEDVFGDAGKANVWLREGLGILDHKAPLDVAQTEAGARVVEQILAKIDWGAAA